MSRFIITALVAVAAATNHEAPAAYPQAAAPAAPAADPWAAPAAPAADPWAASAAPAAPAADPWAAPAPAPAAPEHVAAPAPAADPWAAPAPAPAAPEHVAAPAPAADPWAAYGGQPSYWEGGNLMSWAQPQGHGVDVGVTVTSVNNGGGQEWQQVAAPAKAAGKVHEVTVGGDAGLIYSPSSVQAEIGDVVQFNFLKMNHTVTQSTFAAPCKKMDGGMDSGFMANPDDSMTPPPAFKMEVTTKEPLWFYCKQRMGTHCGKGMVFSINPSIEQSQDTFLQMAIAQNGTGEAAAAVPPMGTGVVAPLATGMSTVVAPPAAAGTVAAPAAAAYPPAHPVAGQAYPGAAADACSCSCLCGVADYPAGMGQGMWGGLPGAMAAPWAQSPAPAAAAPAAGVY